ncbi:MAG: thiolase family protein [Proteobacteria bacterium]|jgi:acetyl-CoA acetyltransferase|nr:thiolase family protein [Pseudomonadota bacterium]
MTETAQAMRDRTAVSGVGLLLGKYPERTSLSLAVEAYDIALADAGLERKDVDGIIQLSYGYDYDRFLEAVGADVRYAYQGWSHGRFVAPMLQHAAMAVATGMAKAVAIVHGRRSKAYGQTADHEMWRQGLGPHGESPAYGALGPAFGAAIAAQRYFHLYGGSNEDLAPIAMAFRKHAQLNPIAVRKDPMSRDDYLKSRWIIEPLRLFDCCQNNDGGACIIVTSAERARDLRKPPVYISGMQGVHAGRQLHNLTLPGLGVAQQDVFPYRPTREDLYAYEMAGVTQKDIDALITYDAFSPLVLFALERFGFCGPGEAREFVKDGRIELGGELPINTGGGLLSEGHMIGWNLFIEAVRQLRHECGERQVKDAQVIQYGSFLGESVIFRR